MTFKTEDIVRDEAANILGIHISNSDKADCGVGQLTTFNRLGFHGFNKSPDGWYLPKNHNDVAIVLETKNSSENISKKKYTESLIENIEILKSRYQKIIGILYNGQDVIVYKNEQQIDAVSELQNKEYYLSLFNEDCIDRNRIYSITKKINDTLHFKFKINNLYHRMIFTACALVAERYDGKLEKVKGLGYATFHTSIFSTLSKSLQKDKQSNSKLELLLEVYSEIRMVEDENQEFIDSFIDDVVKISNSINSDHWNGEDVMAIFFNEFNRYKDKSEHGQVFTPEHITSLMYRIIDIDKDDYVLDAACGSGAFLVKAMSKMIQEAGGVNTTKASDIKGKQLYGIEFDRQIYALACANMLIHKDGKTNLALMDAQTPVAANWIRSKRITKVLMNPPYENKYGCMDIVTNVLNNVQKDTVCAFILPDRKLETVKKSKKLLKKHRLTKIIKLPLKLFDDGGGTSIFVFNAKTPQDNKAIFGCYIKDDGLERVKNQGRHDVSNKWQDIENYWVDVIYKQSGDESIQWIDPNVCLEYMLPLEPFAVTKNDFRKNVLNYALYQKEISLKEVQTNLTNHILYGANISDFEELLINLGKDDSASNNTNVDISKWKEFPVGDLFKITGSKTTKKAILNLDAGGCYPYITTAATNNGVSGYSRIWTEEGNIITVDSATDGVAFYQNRNFSASDHVEKLIPKFEMNVFKALFIVTTLNVNSKRYRYGYDRKRSQTALKNEVLCLPVDNYGIPDFDYMEQFIKSISYTKLL